LNWEKRNYIYFCTLLLVCLFTSIPELISSLQGSFGSSEFGMFRVIRESLLLIMILESVYLFVFINCCKAKIVNIIIFLTIAIYIILIVSKSYINGTSILWIGMGLRPVLMLFLIYSIRFIRLDTDRINGLSRIVKLFLVMQIPACLFQLYFFPPIQGQTIFGPRVFGTFPNPILLSQALSAIFLFLFIMNRSSNTLYWGLVCFMLSIISGGRSGMMGVALIFTYMFLQIFRNKLVKIFALVMSFVIIVCAYFLFSSSALSGREIDTFSKERRLANWGKMLSGLADKGGDRLLLGEFVGSGSNLLKSFSKKSGRDDLARDRYDADSMFIYLIMSYGILGLSIFVLAMVYIFKNIDGNEKYLVFILFLWLGTSQNILEIYPVNIIFIILIGYLLNNKCVQDQVTNNTIIVHNPIRGEAS